MAALTIRTASLTGATFAYENAAAGGDTCANNGKTFLHVKNGSGASITVTVAATGECSQGFTHDAVVAVGAGAEKVIGPFAVERFGATMSVSYSSATTVTVAAVTS